MSALIVVLLRVLALVAGLVIAASVAAAALLAGVLWLVQATLARLAGGSGGWLPRGPARRQPARVYVPSGLPSRRARPDISDVDPRY